MRASATAAACSGGSEGLPVMAETWLAMPRPFNLKTLDLDDLKKRAASLVKLRATTSRMCCLKALSIRVRLAKGLQMAS